MTVSDSLIDNCDSETRIDHQVDDDDKRASPNSIHTIDGLDSNSSSDGGSSESSSYRINIETSLVIILITTVDNTTIIVCLILTLISKTVRDITPAETKTIRNPG